MSFVDKLKVYWKNFHLFIFEFCKNNQKTETEGIPKKKLVGFVFIFLFWICFFLYFRFCWERNNQFLTLKKRFTRFQQFCILFQLFFSGLCSVNFLLVLLINWYYFKYFNWNFLVVLWKNLRCPWAAISSYFIWFSVEMFLEAKWKIEWKTRNSIIKTNFSFIFSPFKKYLWLAKWKSGRKKISTISLVFPLAVNKTSENCLNFSNGKVSLTITQIQGVSTKSWNYQIKDFKFFHIYSLISCLLQILCCELFIKNFKRHSKREVPCKYLTSFKLSDNQTTLVRDLKYFLVILLYFLMPFGKYNFHWVCCVSSTESSVCWKPTKRFFISKYVCFF